MDGGGEGQMGSTNTQTPPTLPPPPPPPPILFLLYPTTIKQTDRDREVDKQA